ncbi:hypothetical protein [Geotalea sp. SG265]|uniref:hypothetical protein n=1 Tax=Geotalea sp. SG265 TaxID=2922867 RepID=UPI001FAED3AD|nr:hypothetical protein [Geotalea sp. SG265]
MKHPVENSLWKYTSMMIVGLIAAGTLIVAGAANLPAGSSMLATFFIVFMGAIIALQLVPGLMLFAAMIKGIYAALRKEKEE